MRHEYEKSNRMKVAITTLSVLAVLLIAPVAHASADISPIQTSPVSWTTGTGFILLAGDQKAVIDTCMAEMTSDAGGATPPTYDLYSEMHNHSFPVGEYTLGLGVLDGSGCGHYWLSTVDVYGTFYWDGTGFTGTNQTTRFIDTAPVGTIAPTGSGTLSVDTWINFDQFQNKSNDWILQFTLTKNHNLFLAAASPELVSGHWSFPLTVGNTDLAYFSTTTDLTQTGTYTFSARIEQKTLFGDFLSFFGLGNLYTPATIIATTTSFIVGTPLPYDTQWGGTMGAPPIVGSTTATSTANDCFSFHLSDCLSFLFWPSAATMASYGAIGDTLKTKPPFGYLSLVINALSSGTTTAASTTPFGITVIAGYLSPLRTGLALIMWFALLLWAFHRFRNFDL